MLITALVNFPKVFLLTYRFSHSADLCEIAELSSTIRDQQANQTRHVVDSENDHLDIIAKEALYENAYQNFSLDLSPILSGKADKSIGLGLESRSFGLVKKPTDLKGINNLASHGSNSTLKKPRRRRTAFTQVRMVNFRLERTAN